MSGTVFPITREISAKATWPPPVDLSFGKLSKKEARRLAARLKESPTQLFPRIQLYEMHGMVHHSPQSLERLERDALNVAWVLIVAAEDRDLILWAEDSVAVRPRIEEALGQKLDLPESTLKLMANYERQRRLKRRERIWWIVGIIATGILSPLLLSVLSKLT